MPTTFGTIVNITVNSISAYLQSRKLKVFRIASSFVIMPTVFGSILNRFLIGEFLVRFENQYEHSHVRSLSSWNLFPPRMNILKRVQNSTLILKHNGELAVKNLRTEAKRFGIHSDEDDNNSGQSRILFQRGTPGREHIHIKSKCDIFLDVGYRSPCKQTPSNGN